MTVDEILVQAESAGAEFRLEGEEVRISYPDDKCRAELSEQIALLRDHRDEVRAFLKARNPWLPYLMPKGVRLVDWQPKCAPVAIDVCTVVVDVHKFVQAELQALDSRLNNPSVIHGGFTVPQMLDRLRQAGVTVELDPKGGAR